MCYRVENIGACSGSCWCCPYGPGRMSPYNPYQPYPWPTPNWPYPYDKLEQPESEKIKELKWLLDMIEKEKEAEHGKEKSG